MALGTASSRGTGFIRTVVIASAIGAGGVANAYAVANTVPNALYDLLLGGILSRGHRPAAGPGRARRRRRRRRLRPAAGDDGHGRPHRHRDPRRRRWRPRSSRRTRTTRPAAARPRGHVRALLPAAAALLRPRRDVRRDPQRPRPVRRADVGAGAQQPRRHRLRASPSTSSPTQPAPRAPHPRPDADPRRSARPPASSLQTVALLPSLRRSGSGCEPRWDWRECGAAARRAVRRLGARLRRHQPARLPRHRPARRVGRATAGACTPSTPTPTSCSRLPYAIVAVTVITALFPGMSRSATEGDEPAVARHAVAGPVGRRRRPGARRRCCSSSSARRSRSSSSSTARPRPADAHLTGQVLAGVRDRTAAVLGVPDAAARLARRARLADADARQRLGHGDQPRPSTSRSTSRCAPTTSRSVSRSATPRRTSSAP